MASTIRWIAMITFALAMAGCSVLPQTTLEVIQNDTSISVDTSQVPEEWLERSERERRIGKTHTIRLKPSHKVKVVLVPE